MPRLNPNDAELKAELEQLFSKLVSARRLWTLRRARREFERAYCDYVIARSSGDRHHAAARLGIGFSTLKEKIRKTKP